MFLHPYEGLDRNRNVRDISFRCKGVLSGEVTMLFYLLCLLNGVSS